LTDRRTPREELIELEVVHRSGANAGVDQVGDRGGNQHGTHDEAAVVQHEGTLSWSTGRAYPEPPTPRKARRRVMSRHPRRRRPARRGAPSPRRGATRG